MQLVTESTTQYSRRLQLPSSPAVGITFAATPAPSCATALALIAFIIFDLIPITTSVIWHRFTGTQRRNCQGQTTPPLCWCAAKHLRSKCTTGNSAPPRSILQMQPALHTLTYSVDAKSKSLATFSRARIQQNTHTHLGRCDRWQRLSTDVWPGSSILSLPQPGFTSGSAPPASTPFYLPAALM